MLECKTFELRDRMTFIPIVAVNCGVRETTRPLERTSEDQYLLRRAGYGPDCDCIILTRLDAQGGKSSQACCDPFMWNDRTFTVAHQYIEANWGELASGQVIDVEFLLGEVTTPKVSERETAQL